MENQYKFENITDRQLKQKGVQALADRPNVAGQYGQSGLSPTQLKLWFDNLGKLLAEKINKIQDAIQSEDAAKYIGLALGRYKTFDELFIGIQDGTFAAEVLKLLPNENALELATLQDIIYGIAQSISDIKEDIKDLGDKKLTKVTETATHKRIYGVDSKGEQVMLDAASSPTGQVPLYSTSGALIAKMTPIEGMPGGEYPSEVVNMAFINEFSRHIGAKVKIVVDPNTFEFYVDIYNKFDEWVGRSNKVDLPLEETVINVTYDENEKSVIVMLKNGEERKIPVAHFVSGLVTDAKHKADIEAIYNKYDSWFNAYVQNIYDIVGGDYIDYS